MLAGRGPTGRSLHPHPHPRPSIHLRVIITMDDSHGSRSRSFLKVITTSGLASLSTTSGSLKPYKIKRSFPTFVWPLVLYPLKTTTSTYSEAKSAIHIHLSSMDVTKVTAILLICRYKPQKFVAFCSLRISHLWLNAYISRHPNIIHIVFA